jgi:pimeloyl-ACP methyl ester carboxylesterase
MIALLLLTNTYAQDISGTWSGEVRISTEKVIEFNFHITHDGKSYKTVIDVPTNRVKGLKPKKTTYLNKELLVDGSNLGIKYKGIYDSSTQKFRGKFTEGQNQFSLALKKFKGKQQLLDIKRPQEPKRPYPYFEEEVIFSNVNAGITLAGTFTRPKTDKKHPTVILITGSGPQDRDQTFSGHKTFLVLADYLTRQGIAVLRYDDRGTSKSTGNFQQATTEDFATDVVAAVNYLKKRNDVDLSNIGLIGHSEGGIIAPLAANKTNNDVAFIVSLAGTGILGSEFIYQQVVSNKPFSVPDEEKFNKTIRKGIKIASSSKSTDVIKSELKTHYNKELAPILRPILGSDEKTRKAIIDLIEARTTPWMRFFYNYNPADEYAKVTIPVLSLYGSKDTQVSPKVNQEGMRNAFKKSKNGKSVILEIENLNHLFQEADTGQMDEYIKIEQTFSVKALKIIADWILKTVK